MLINNIEGAIDAAIEGATNLGSNLDAAILGTEDDPTEELASDSQPFPTSALDG